MQLQELINMTHYDHSRKVSVISGLLARQAGFPPEEALTIKQAALYHDIGKGMIPQSILQKPGKLTPAEFAIVKTHTALGHDQINDARRILDAADIMASYHHEKCDGSGYYGLMGDDIHPYARLVAVADVFDALISKRAYKEPWDIQSICQYFEAQAGTQFDSGITVLLLGMLDEILLLYKDDAVSFQEAGNV